MGEIIAAAVLFTSLYCGEPRTYMLFDPSISDAPMFFMQEDVTDPTQPWGTYAAAALSRPDTLAFTVEQVPEDRRSLVCKLKKGTSA